jgi:hypothetical protein
MHDSQEPGHTEASLDDKEGYVDEKSTVSFEDEEIEPVVTPKTWVVVGVSYTMTLPSSMD